MESEGFRVGHFWIEWRDEDTVSITNTRLGRYAVLRGGDFESLLSGVVESAHLSIRDALRDMPKPSGFPPTPPGKPPHGVYG